MCLDAFAMKKTKLVFRAETLRNLTATPLRAVVGGVPYGDGEGGGGGATDDCVTINCTCEHSVAAKSYYNDNNAFIRC
jgi:hypothetical protein